MFVNVILAILTITQSPQSLTVLDANLKKMSCFDSANLNFIYTSWIIFCGLGLLILILSRKKCLFV